MTLPSIFLGLIVSSLFGAFFHLWRGGGPGRLLLYLLLSWFGFWGGHNLGIRWEWNFLSLGPLHLGTAIFGSVIALAIGYWLSLVDMGETN
jgi:hypothetical protein